MTRLSGGQRQRVALARALAIDPPILLLDEPLSNLDARIRQNMRHEVRSLQQRLGLTAILVTHDREEAMSMADRMVILDAGRIAQVGTPEEVYQRPATGFVAGFMGAENAYPVEVRRENGAVSVSGPHVTGEARLPFAASLADEGVNSPSGGEGPMVARFRSEAAALVESGRPPDAHFALSGRVVRHSYLGSIYRHSVRVGEHEFLVDHPRRIAADRPVAICIPAGALNLFEPDTGASPSAGPETEPLAAAAVAAARGPAPSTPTTARGEHPMNALESFRPGRVAATAFGGRTRGGARRRHRQRGEHPQRRERRLAEHGRLRDRLPRTALRGAEPGMDGARRRHRAR